MFIAATLCSKRLDNLRTSYGLTLFGEIRVSEEFRIDILYRRAIIWTNAVILLIGPIGTNFSEILIKMYIFSFKEMHLKLSSGNWRQFCLALNVYSTVMTKCGLLCRWPCWDGLIHEMFFFQMADPVPDTLLDTYTIHLLEDDEGKHQTHKEVYCKE